MISGIALGLNTFGKMLSSEATLLFTALLGLTIKIYLLIISYKYAKNSKYFNSKFIIFLSIILGTIFEDFSWAVKIFRSFGLINNYNLVIFTIRLAWIFCIVHYQALILFSNMLIPFSFKSKINKFFCNAVEFFNVTLGTILCTIFLYLSFFKYNLTETPRYIFQNSIFKYFNFNTEIDLIHFVYWYLLSITFVNLLILSFKVNSGSSLIKIPSLIKKQAKMLLAGIIIPKFCSELIQAYQFTVYSNAAIIQPLYSISCILTIIMFFFYIKQIIGLRLLNFSNKVETFARTKFLEELKKTLDKLNIVQEVNEVRYITQNFFEKSFKINPENCYLYLKNKSDYQDQNIYKIISLNNNNLTNFEEIEFNYFYEENLIIKEKYKKIIDLMNELNTKLIIPIKSNEKIFGAITLNKQEKKIFGTAQQEEFLIFSSYLAHTIYTLDQVNIKKLVQKCRSLEEDIYQKHNEIKQYKESLKNLLKNNSDQSVGVLYYKNKKFNFANKSATIFIDYDINQQLGHDLTKVLLNIVKHVEKYKTSQVKHYTDDQTNKKYLINALPHLDNNNIIITISNADATNIIKEQINELKNPSDWDYLLYLKTTNSGNYINKLIPGNSEKIINLKTQLLKLAITKKSLFLSGNKNDINILIKLVHDISLKEELVEYTVNKNKKISEIYIDLFGSKQILNEKKGILNNFNGTLVLNNIENLPYEVQIELAETIRYGTYKPYMANDSIQTEARILFTTTLFPEVVSEKKLVNSKLLQELEEQTIEFPLCESIENNELTNIIKSIAKKYAPQNDLTNIFELKEREINKIIKEKPASFYDLHTKIKEKIEQKNIIESDIEKTYNLSDPKVLEAAKLGKKALKNKDMMNILWKTFKNQNQIADILKVNRSSVNRRCREFGIS